MTNLSIVISKKTKQTVSNETFCSNLIHVKALSDEQRKNKLKTLTTYSKKHFPTSGDFHLKWLKKILIKIDQLWFESELFTKITEVYGGMTLYTSIKEERIAGYVLESKDRISFHINRDLFMELFSNGDKGYHSGGLVCKDRLTCLLHVLLHEMVHVCLSLCDRLKLHKDVRHHGKVFSNITKHLFGHTDSKHGLIPGLDHTHDLESIKKNLKVGQNVKIYLNESWIPVKIVKKSRIRADVESLDGKKTRYSVHAGLIKIDPNDFKE
jgi:hypothetical protein